MNEYKYPYYHWWSGTNNKNFVPRPNDEYLYHYTTAKALIQILNGMELKLSSFNNLNDVSEIQSNWINSSIDTIIPEIVTQQFIIEKCSFISFTTNYRKGGLYKTGAEHPRMWAQYGENHYGACIVLRKKDFLSVNKKVLKGKFYKLEKVKYTIVPNDAIIDENSESEELVKHNYRSLFFCKDKDWKEECEYRLFGVDLPNYLSIDGALAYICLGHRFFKKRSDDIDYGDELFNLFVDNKTRCYEKLKPHSFSQIECSNKGYYEADASGSIYELCNNYQFKGNQAKAFLRWSEK